MSETTTDADLASRRAVLAGVAGVGVAAALAACGDNSSSSGANPGTNPGGDTGDNTGASIAKKSDIPEGGGKIFPQERVVITQPTAGTFKAFDATCQHQFCLVTSVAGGTINCDCHGSKYGLADGSVKVGPTTKPLIPKTVTVDGDNLKVS
jgi:Rieske Fe-S protein